VVFETKAWFGKVWLGFGLCPTWISHASCYWCTPPFPLHRDVCQLCYRQNIQYATLNNFQTVHEQGINITIEFIGAAYDGETVLIGLTTCSFLLNGRGGDYPAFSSKDVSP